jgi:hypothetical protein
MKMLVLAHLPYFIMKGLHVASSSSAYELAYDNPYLRHSKTFWTSPRIPVNLI